MSQDGAWVYVAARFERPLVIDRIHLPTGRREAFRTLELQRGDDRMGSSGYLTADGSRWFSHTTELKSQLFMVQGLK